MLSRCSSRVSDILASPKRVEVKCEVNVEEEDEGKGSTTTLTPASKDGRTRVEARRRADRSRRHVLLLEPRPAHPGESHPPRDDEGAGERCSARGTALTGLY